MGGIKDYVKRSLVFLLVCMLTIQGVDLSVFADADADDGAPVIESNLTVATSFYDICDAKINNHEHTNTNCKYGTDFGLVFPEEITIPFDTSNVENLADYSKDNLVSIDIYSELYKDENGNKKGMVISEAEYKYDWGQHGKKNIVKSYLPFGYCIIDSKRDGYCYYDNNLKKFFESCMPDTLDKTNKDAVRDFATEFIKSEFEITVTWNVNGVEKSASTELDFQEYPYVQHLENSTYVSSLLEILDNSNGNNRLSRPDYTSAGYVISVPTSKTVVDNDFYKDDSNAIAVVDDSNNLYNTYYVNVESGSSIQIPFNDFYYEDKITKVSFDDTCVYDSNNSIELNGGTVSSISPRLYNLKLLSGRHIASCANIVDNSNYGDRGNEYIIRDFDINKILKSTLHTNKVTYNGEVLNIDDIDFSTIDLDDFINNTIVEYISKNTGLLDSEEYSGNADDYDFLPWSYDINSTSNYYIVDIKLKNWFNCDELQDLDLSSKTDELGYKTNVYYTEYLSSETSTDSSYANDKYVNTFYGLESEDYSDNYNSSLYLSAVKKDSLGSKTKSSCIIKIPDLPYYNSTTEKFIKKLQENESYSSRVYVFVNKGSSCGFFKYYNLDDYSYNSFDSSSSFKVDDKVEGYSYNSYYLKFDFSGLSDELIDCFKSYIMRCFKSTVDYSISSFNRLMNSEYGVDCYKFEVPINTEGIDEYMNAIDTAEPASLVKNIISYTKSSDNSKVILEVPYLYARYLYTSPNNIIPGFKILSDKMSDIYRYEAKNIDSMLTFDELNISKEDYTDFNSDFSGYGIPSTRYDGKFKSLTNLHDLSGNYFREIKINIPVSAYNNYCLSEYPTAEECEELTKTLVSELEANDAVIDYENSYMPNFNNNDEFYLKGVFEGIDRLDSSAIFVYDVLAGCHSNLRLVKGAEGVQADSVTTGNHVKTSTVCTNGGITIPNNLFRSDKGKLSKMSVLSPTNKPVKGKSYSINMQVYTPVYARFVKNANQAVNVVINDTDDVNNLINNSDVICTSFDTRTAYELCSYFDYKFGNIIFASRPSVVRNLDIDEKGNVTWNKSADEGLGIDENGNALTDKIINVDSYTLYVSDKDGTELYTTTQDPSVTTKSAISTKRVRGMSSNPTTDAYLTIPEAYNVEGNIITVFATNAIGDSDEVSIVIPARVTPTPTITPTLEPTVSPTLEPTVSPTLEPTVSPTPTRKPYYPPYVPSYTVEPTGTPEITPTAVPTPTSTVEPLPTMDLPIVVPNPTKIPEYTLVVEDVYYNEEGAEEKRDTRLKTTVNHGDIYRYQCLDKEDYTARVSEHFGTVTSDVKIIFEYDKKKSNKFIVQGYVKKQNGTPISNSLVEIIDKDSKTSITDDTGFYRIDGVSGGEHEYTLYSGATTGTSVIAKCSISVKDNNGNVEIKFNSSGSKVNTNVGDGAVNIDAIIYEEVTPEPTVVPTATVEPIQTRVPVQTEVPTVEPTILPTIEPTVVPTSTPTLSPTVKPTAKPTSKPSSPSTAKPRPTVKPTKKPVAKPTYKPVVKPTVKPSVKPTDRLILVQTGMYDGTKLVVALILVSVGVFLIVRRKKK